MNCKTAIRLIYLYKEGELSKEEELQLNNHLTTCYHCMSVKRGLGLYEDVINDFAESEPYMSGHEQVTSKILDGIKPSEIRTIETVAGLFRIPFIRVAASVLILLQAGVFSYQQFIPGIPPQKNQRRSSLINDTSVSLNKACIEESKKIIIDVLGYEDPEFNRKAINYRRNLTGSEIEEYASKVCQYSDQLQKITGRKKKKDLLINLINSELNLKL